MNSGGDTGGWGAGNDLFGAAPSAEDPSKETKDLGSEGDEVDDSDNPSDTEDEDESAGITAALAATSLTTDEEKEWAKVPSYTPIYLDTASEYIAPPARSNSKTAAHISEGGGDDSPWALEGYESVHKVNEVFERFLKRTNEEATQCIRYVCSPSCHCDRSRILQVRPIRYSVGIHARLSVQKIIPYTPT